jgi:hypothetical protein
VGGVARRASERAERWGVRDAQGHAGARKEVCEAVARRASERAEWARVRGAQGHAGAHHVVASLPHRPPLPLTPTQGTRRARTRWSSRPSSRTTSRASAASSPAPSATAASSTPPSDPPSPPWTHSPPSPPLPCDPPTPPPPAYVSIPMPFWLSGTLAPCDRALPPPRHISPPLPSSALHHPFCPAGSDPVRRARARAGAAARRALWEVQLAPVGGAAGPCRRRARGGRRGAARGGAGVGVLAASVEAVRVSHGSVPSTGDGRACG